MPQFRFEAVDPSGRRIRGDLAGTGLSAIEAELEGRGLTTLTVQELDAGSKSGARWGSHRDVLEVSRSVSALLDAGLSLPRSLSLTEGHVPERIRGVLVGVRESVERGEPLATALNEHPRLFSPLYRGLVRAGERSGELADAYRRLVAHLEREEETRGRIVSASIYPLLLVGLGGASLVAILLWVVPRFASLVTDAGASLPPVAAGLLAVSEVVRQSWLGMLLLLVAIGGGLAALASSRSGRARLGRATLSMPLVGDIRREVLAARFARMLGTMLGGGAPVLRALSDVEESAADPVLEEATRAVGTSVRHGERLASAMDATDFFPETVTRLVGIGEDSGRLPDFALKASEILERRTERRVQRAVSLIEPTVIVVFGGLIAIVAVALLQAIYSVNAGSF